MCDRSDLRQRHSNPLDVEIALEAEHMQALVIACDQAHRPVPSTVRRAAEDMARWSYSLLKVRGPRTIDPLKTPGLVPLEGLEHVRPRRPDVHPTQLELD